MYNNIMTNQKEKQYFSFFYHFSWKQIENKNKYE
jgi:hypothetical protein